MKHEKREIIYSVAILFTIPIIVVVNTVMLIQSTSQAYNSELRRKADLANGVIAQSSLKQIQDKQYSAIQDNLNSLENSQPTLQQSTVIINDNGRLRVVARSSSAPEGLTPNRETEAKLALDRKTSIAALVNTRDREKNMAQAWHVTTPVLDSGGNAIAAVSASFLTADAQEAIDTAYQQSFFILAASIILIVALLFRHFRLVGYVKLLAKQRELNQTMSDFLSVATHELKAPTSIIKGYLSNVMDGDYGDVSQPIMEQLKIAVAQTDRLNSLVKDLLNVSRIDQGRVEYTFTAVDTSKILQLVVDNYRPIAAEKGLRLIYQPHTGLPLVRADEGRVQEIFTNLVDNAIKYTATGSVTISQQLDNNMVATHFHDTGFGISPEAKQRLFQRFYRVQTSETKTISGTGLGLWIIKQYVLAMNGSIDVETMQTVGSNFIVKLPADSTGSTQK